MARTPNTAASSENDQGSMNLASNTAPLPSTRPSRVAAIHFSPSARPRPASPATAAPGRHVKHPADHYTMIESANEDVKASPSCDLTQSLLPRNSKMHFDIASSKPVSRPHQ